MGRARVDSLRRALARPDTLGRGALMAEIQRQVAAIWHRTEDWTEKTILNTVNVGWFSSDRTIRDYAREIWHVPVA